MTAKSERNRKMAIAVLRGYNYTQVGKVFGVTRNFVRLVVLRDLCRLLGYDLFRQYKRFSVFPLGIKEIREKHKYRLIEKLNEGELI